jgi:hypothetical protein
MNFLKLEAGVIDLSRVVAVLDVPGDPSRCRVHFSEGSFPNVESAGDDYRSPWCYLAGPDVARIKEALAGVGGGIGLDMVRG